MIQLSNWLPDFRQTFYEGTCQRDQNVVATRKMLIIGYPALGRPGISLSAVPPV